jgi:DnaJ family protein C protein 28
MPIRREGNTIEAGSSWADIVERKIQDAMERGLFDNLKGLGKPLEIDENPYEGEWRLAFKILRNAGAAPAWIELGREIEAELASLERLMALAKDNRGNRREQLRAQCLHKLEEINRKIDEFNLAVPMIWLQKAHLDPGRFRL